MVNPSSTCNDYINKNKNFKILKTIFYFESRLIIKKKKKKQILTTNLVVS